MLKSSNEGMLQSQQGNTAPFSKKRSYIMDSLDVYTYTPLPGPSEYIGIFKLRKRQSDDIYGSLGTF